MNLPPLEGGEKRGDDSCFYPSLWPSPTGERAKGIEYGHEFRPKISKQNGVRKNNIVILLRRIVSHDGSE